MTTHITVPLKTKRKVPIISTSAGRRTLAENFSSVHSNEKNKEKFYLFGKKNNNSRS
jgi:hypothetical protein